MNAAAYLPGLELAIQHLTVQAQRRRKYAAGLDGCPNVPAQERDMAEAAAHTAEELLRSLSEVAMYTRHAAREVATVRDAYPQGVEWCKCGAELHGFHSGLCRHCEREEMACARADEGWTR